MAAAAKLKCGYDGRGLCFSEAFQFLFEQIPDGTFGEGMQVVVIFFKDEAGELDGVAARGAFADQDSKQLSIGKGL
jgi:hypothetical protein